MNKQENLDISFFDLVQFLFEKRKNLILVFMMLSLMAVVYALMLPNFYQSSALLEVREQNESSGVLGNLPSQMGNLASIAGINLNQAGGPKKNLIIETILSREFLSELLKFDGVRQNLTAVKSIRNGVMIYDQNLYIGELGKWQDDAFPSDLEVYRDFYRLNLSINSDSKTGFIFIGYEHLSPTFSQEFVTLIINQINNKMRNRVLSETSRSIDFLSNSLASTIDVEIRRLLANLLESEISKRMLADIHEDYSLIVIDKPFVPEKKSSPARAILCILIVSFGMLAYITFLLFYNFLWTRLIK